MNVSVPTSGCRSREWPDPIEQDGQPVGTLYMGFVGPGFDDVRHARLPGQREQMRQFSVITALGLLRTELAAR